MKKLLCLSLLVMGFFVSVEAQTLTYKINNFSGADWEYGMEDANGNTLIAASIPSGTSANGTSFTFTLPVRYRASNSVGCSVGEVITGPIGPISPSYICTPNGGQLTYQLAQDGFNYRLEVYIN